MYRFPVTGYRLFVTKFMSTLEPQEESQKTPQPESQYAEVIVDRELCIGAATCIAVAPNAFELDNDAKAVYKPGHGHDDATILASAQSCPVYAIILKSKEGKKVYPEQ